jgi:hypothetical protein
LEDNSTIRRCKSVSIKFVSVRFSNRAQRRASIRRAESTRTVIAVFNSEFPFDCIAEGCGKQAPTFKIRTSGQPVLHGIEERYRS